MLERVFAELSQHRNRWREALEGLGVEKSPYLESIRKEERLKTQSRAVVKILKAKFGEGIPAELSTTIQKTADEAKQDAWTGLAAVSPSLADFRREAGI